MRRRGESEKGEGSGRREGKGGRERGGERGEEREKGKRRGRGEREKECLHLYLLCTWPFAYVPNVTVATPLVGVGT